MADNEGCRAAPEAFLVCTSPDVCWTQVGDKKVLVPYQIYAKLTDVVYDVPTVRLASENAVNMDTRITTVYGDEEGIHGGEKSGVNKGWCRPITHSTTVRVDGAYLIYNTSIYWMNCNGPDGPGNTQGEIQLYAAGTAPYGGPLVDLEQMREDAEKSWWDSVSPWLHGAIDIVGLIPGVGEIADGVNAAIYLAEGNYTDAALSAAAMIPFAGWGATAAKYGDEVVAGAKYIDEVVEGSKHIDEAVDASKHVDEAVDAGKHTDEAVEAADDVPPTKPKDGATVTKPKPPAKGSGHAKDRHGPNRDKTKYPDDKKSHFDSDADIDTVISESDNFPATESRGNMVTTFESSVTGTAVDQAGNMTRTNTMTVITKPDGTVITAHPGPPWN